MQNYFRQKLHISTVLYIGTFSFHFIIYSCMYFHRWYKGKLHFWAKKPSLSLLFPPKTKFNLKWNINGIHISSLPLPTDQKWNPYIPRKYIVWSIMLILYGRPCFKWGSLSKNMCLTMPRNRKNSAMKIQNVGKSWYMIAGSPSEQLHTKILQKKS